MYNQSLVSVIIPTYKRPDKLNITIKSVQNQTYNNYELIIIDDNNADDEFRKQTEFFMEKYKSDSKINYIKHEKNKGGSYARNTGIKASNGKYIAFLDDDDYWLPRKLEILINDLEKKSDEYGASYSSYYIIKDDDQFKDTQSHVEGNIYKRQLLKDYISPTSAVVIKKKCFEKVGLFDERLPARQDYDLWIRIAKYYKFSYIDIPLVKIIRNSNWESSSISSNYVNNLKGTKIIMSKMKRELKNYPSKFKDLFYAEHYKYLGKMCLSFNQFNLGKKYLYKSLKAKVQVKTLVLYFLSNMHPAIWRIIKKINWCFKIHN